MTKIKPFGIESLDIVVALDISTNGGQRHGFFKKRFEAQEKHPLSFVSLSASTDGNLVGFVCCHMQKGEFGSDELVAVLDAMAVEPGHQGQGVGHQLLAELMTEIRQRGGKELRTQAGWNQPGILDFFSAVSFQMGPGLILERATSDFSNPGRSELDDLSRDDILVRSLAAGDIDEVVRIDAKITGRQRRDFYERKFQEVLFESGVRLSLIAELDGMVVGFMMARVDFGEFGRTASEAVIDTLGVIKAFRSQRIGHALLAQLLGNLSILRVESVRSEVDWNNFSLLGFLDSCGFTPSQRLALSCDLTRPHT